MASTYPSINDREFDLLKKIANNTALIADDEVGDVASITGTANQVIVSQPTGAVTLSLPQSIATTSSPTFASPIFTGLLTLSSTSGTNAGGLKWGASEFSTFRVSNNVLQTLVAANGTYGTEVSDGTKTVRLSPSNGSTGNPRLVTRTNHALEFGTNDTLALTLASDQSATFSPSGATNNTKLGVTSGYTVFSFNNDVGFATACGIAAKGSGGDEKLYALVPDTSGTGFYYKVGNTPRFTIDRYGCVATSVGATTTALTDLLINPTTKASGNFIDAQISGTSKFKVAYDGGMTATDIYAGATNWISWTGRATMVASGVGTIAMRTYGNAADAAITAGAATLSGALQLGNAYVATPQVTTGYVTIKDSTGTTYKVLVAA